MFDYAESTRNPDSFHLPSASPFSPTGWPEPGEILWSGLEIGQYATYLATFGPEEWEAYSIFLEARLPDNSWGTRFVVKRADMEIAFYFKLKEQPGNHEPPALLSYRMLRGPEPDEKLRGLFIARAMNLLNVRVLPLSGKVEGQASSAPTEGVCCGLSNFLLFDDPWPEFGYTMKHSFHPGIPIVGLAGSTIPGRDFRVAITSFGINTRNMADAVFPTFVEFDNLRSIQHEDFEMKYPTSWSLLKTPTNRPGEILYGTGSLGGNIHAGYAIVRFFSGSPEEINARYNIEVEQKGIIPGLKDQFSFRRSLTLEGGLPNHNAFISDLRFSGQTGITLVLITKSSDGRTLAIVSLFSNYGMNNPLKEEMPEVERKFMEIAASFRFRGAASPAPVGTSTMKIFSQEPDRFLSGNF